MKPGIILYNVILIDPTSKKHNPRIVIHNIERFDKSIPLELDLENSALLFLFSTCKAWKKELEGLDLEHLVLDDWETGSQEIYSNHSEIPALIPLPTVRLTTEILEN
ncbi:MAG: hypothetical protein QNJ38_13980 [Prochloraceae cyanobacterium]|nr:hypothetical protein [Prochloraceae cyanobacterium]